MTEPPEPRRPEDEGGGELEPDADAPVGSDEWFDQLDDDVLLDQLGRGDDIDDGALGELLSAERDRVQRQPLPPGTSPEVVQEIHDFNQEVDRATRPPDSGGTNPMSLQESIATLSGIAGNTSASGPLSEANSAMSNTVLPAAQQAVEQLASMAGQARTAAEGNAELSSEVGSTGEHAANAIEEVIDLVNSTITAIGQAVEHEAVFRRTCESGATRLAGG